jgi:CO/xanthine dehydrogenase FAD-binding subunit
MSSAGTRRVPYLGFHRGYKQIDLARGEIIARVILPARSLLGPGGGGSSAAPAGAGPEVREFYRKVGTRRAQAISKVCMAGMVAFDRHAAPDRPVVADIRIALGSVAPTVIRATRTEDVLRGRAVGDDAMAEAQRTLVSEIAPIDDLRSTARYRAAVAGNLLREFLLSSAGDL